MIPPYHILIPRDDLVELRWRHEPEPDMVLWGGEEVEPGQDFCGLTFEELRSQPGGRVEIDEAAGVVRLRTNGHGQPGAVVLERPLPPISGPDPDEDDDFPGYTLEDLRNFATTAV